MVKILSIIIPSYNMEAYLPQCLDSLLVENLKDIEVLIVNDGSKDNTLSIAKSYQNRYPGSIFVIDKPNGNYGSCINAALKVANGKYVKVLDADDSFEKEYFNRFIDFLKKRDADLIISDFVMVNEEGNITSKISFLNLREEKNSTFRQCLDILCQPRFQMHAVTLRRDILARINYKQLEGVSYTDQQWMFTPMNEVESVAFFPHVVYKYLVGREGQTVSRSVSYKSLNQTIFVEKHLLKVYNTLKNGKDPDHNKYLKARLMQKLPTIYRIGILKTDNDELRKCLTDFDEEFKLLNEDLYAKLNYDKIAGFPLPYIKHWRKHKDYSSFCLKLMREITMYFYRIK